MSPASEQDRTTRYSLSHLILPPDSLLDKAREVAEEVRRRGGRAVIVGGWVRDSLLGQSPKDADLEVFGIQPDELQKLLRRFGRVGCVGESFRVYKLTWHQRPASGETDGEAKKEHYGERRELDVSIPRRDRKVGEGHRGFEVEGDPFATYEEAARRRDFTINTIGCDPLNGEVLDPYGGRADLAAGLLKMVDAVHFGEDSLRVLRAMQFAARFELQLDSELVALCRSIDLTDLPRERIWGEWEKLLLKAARPSRGLAAAHELAILERLFPALDQVWRRKSAVLGANLDRAAELRTTLPVPQQVTLMLAVIGAELSRSELEAWLDALGVYTLERYNVRENVFRLHAEQGRVCEFHEAEATREVTELNAALRRLSVRCDPELLYHLARVRGETEAAEWFHERMNELGVYSGPPAALVMGRHLLDMGMKPGPRIGEITRAVYEKQLDGEIDEFGEALNYARTLL